MVSIFYIDFLWDFDGEYFTYFSAVFLEHSRDMYSVVR